MRDIDIERLRDASRKLVRELGLLELSKKDSNETPAKWHALIEINNNPGISISKLGSILIMSLPMISRIVKSQIKEGLVEYNEGIDKREKHLKITELGKESIKRIDEFSTKKINAASKILPPNEMLAITSAIAKYANALEQSRSQVNDVKIARLNTSRLLRHQVVAMIANILINEFNITPSTPMDAEILKAEIEFCYNNSCNFWYAHDTAGQIIGCIGLKKLDEKNAELKRFCVTSEYRGKGVAQKLFATLIKSAQKHQFTSIYLGCIKQAVAAQRLYQKLGFNLVEAQHLPSNFTRNQYDELFYHFCNTY